MKPPARRVARLCLVLLSTLLAAVAGAESEAPLPEDGRVLIAPLNLGVHAPPELDDATDVVWDELLDVLDGQQRAAALEPGGARALWHEVMRDGERDVYQAYARFARRVARQAPYAVMVIPALVTRPVEVRNQRAAWDGVERTVQVPKAGTSLGHETREPISVETRGGRGTLMGASLNVAILTPDGAIRFEGAGGLALLQRLDLSAPGQGVAIRVAERPDAFADEEAVRQGVRIAFERPLPAAPAR
ncbi:MAG: hypothetical protein ACQGVC_01615 [Myxococcota bacterium]